MPPPSGDFLVGEEVLQFHGLRHANRLKAVSRLPMPEHDSSTHFFGVKDFPA